MPINKKLINFKTKTQFDAKLKSGDILTNSIVFIEDTGQIWTHGKLYGGSINQTANKLNRTEMVYANLPYSYINDGETISFTAPSVDDYATANTSGGILFGSSNTAGYLTIRSGSTDAEFYVRSWYNSNFSSWRKLYHSGNINTSTVNLSAKDLNVYSVISLIGSGKTSFKVTTEPNGGAIQLFDSTGTRKLLLRGYEYSDNIQLLLEAGGIKSAGEIFANNDKKVWHSGNFDPSTKLNVSGGTLTGALHFKNLTWNNIGDDVAIGDCNQSGQLGIKALNNTIPGIKFYDNAGTAIGSLTSNAGTLQWAGSTLWNSSNSNSSSIDWNARNLYIGLNGVITSPSHNLYFGGTNNYAHTTYYFRPQWGSAGNTQSNLVLQSANTAGTMTTRIHLSASETESFVSAGKFIKSGVTDSAVLLGAGGHISYSTDGTASTIAARDSAGDLNCRLVRTTYGDQSTIGGGIVFRVNNSNDNYLRVCNSQSAIRTWLGVPDTNHTHQTITSRGRIDGTAAPSTYPAGISMSEAYSASWPTSYGNVLTLKGGGDTQLFMEWSGSQTSSNNAITSNMYLRSRRDNLSAWSDFSRVCMFGQNIGTGASNYAAGNHGHTGLATNGWNGVRSTTPSGWIDLGPANADWAHIYTDRPNFYFNKHIYINNVSVSLSNHTHNYAGSSSAGGVATKAYVSEQLEAFTAGNFTGGSHYVKAIRYDGWHTRLYMGYHRDDTRQNTVHVGYADSATYAGFIPPRYDGGVIVNPQQYFDRGIGVRVAMTGTTGSKGDYWGDTLWINGYGGGDVPNCCALHFSRYNARMFLSIQNAGGTSYGTLNEIWHEGNFTVPHRTGIIASGTVNAGNGSFYAHHFKVYAPNVTMSVSKVNTGTYRLTHNIETYYPNSGAVGIICTGRGATPCVVTLTAITSTYLEVKVYSLNGALINNDFNFLILHPAI